MNPVQNQISLYPFLNEPSWLEVLAPECQKTYFKELLGFLKREYEFKRVYPPKQQVFTAFNETPYSKVKVVIVGQDPYHGPGQAHGLCFSVSKGIKPPPSLENIFKELQADVGVTRPSHGCLLHWAQQGVLLLNATLTVEESQPLSHHGKGWEQFTDAVIRLLCQRKEPIAFVLWGKSAQEKFKCVQDLNGLERHLILQASHPSPFSAKGFLGCHHFSKINQWLLMQNYPPIDWGLG